MVQYLLTVTDVTPITDSTGADSNEDSDIFPSQVGLAVLTSASVGINCITNIAVLLDTSSYKKEHKMLCSIQ